MNKREAIEMKELLKFEYNIDGQLIDIHRYHKLNGPNQYDNWGVLIK